MLPSELPAAQSAKCFLIFPTRLFCDAFRQCRSRRLLIPADALQIVAHKLLVKRKLRAARGVSVRRPEARGVGRKDLIRQDDAPRCDSELKFGIRQDDAL